MSTIIGDLELQISQRNETIDKLRAQLRDLAEHVDRVVPYVTATVSPGNIQRSKERPEWVEVHGGRASSSYNQLRNLRDKAKELLKDLDAYERD